MRRTSILIWALAALLPACSGETQEDDEAPPPNPPDEIDLVVDANWDGIAKLDDPADQDHEFEWSAFYGAGFLPNLDDDDGDHLEDAVDQIVNGEGDAFDLARIVVRPWAAAPAGATAIFTLDGIAVGHVRVYLMRPGAGWELVAGAVGPCGHNADSTCEYRASYTIATADLQKGVELGIEALHFAGGPDARRVHEAFGLAIPDDPRCKDPQRPVSLSEFCAWTGMVQIELQGKDAQGKPIVTEGNPTDGIDKALMRVSPWVANHNLRKYNQVHFNGFSAALVNTLTPALQQSNVEAVTYPSTADSGGDIWYEDWMQTGWAAIPSANGVQGFEVFNPRPWGRPPNDTPTPEEIIQYSPGVFLRKTMLGPDRAVAVFWDEGPPGMSPADQVTNTEIDAGTSYDSHGNHDALPSWPDAPMGRILTGSGILQTTKDFYASQVQPPIAVDTSWLTVGHIDEVVAPVAANTERGWKLLINTPSLGRQLFQDLEAQGQGAAIVFPLKAGWTTTVAEANADTVLMSWNQESQTRVDAIRDQLIAEAGLAPEEIIDVPVLYEQISGGKIAWLPDTANVRVIDNGNTGIFATTQGPIVNGNDTMKAWLETNLTDPANGLGSDGQGLDVRFGDSWQYHINLGDIHCATNFTGPPTADEPLWWSAFQ